MTTPEDARRVLLAELERAGFDPSSLPPSLLERAVARIVCGGATVAHTVEFFRASERLEAAIGRGEIDHPTAVLIVRQLRERQSGERLGD